MTARTKSRGCLRVATVAAVLIGTAWLSRSAAQAPPGMERASRLYPTYEADDNAGFVPIFDGKTLDGWER